MEEDICCILKSGYDLYSKKRILFQNKKVGDNKVEKYLLNYVKSLNKGCRVCMRVEMRTGEYSEVKWEL